MYVYLRKRCQNLCDTRFVPVVRSLVHSYVPGSMPSQDKECSDFGRETGIDRDDESLPTKVMNMTISEEKIGQT